MSTFEIILIAMIAAFILLRLRAELGNKTGNEHGHHTDDLRHRTMQRTTSMPRPQERMAEPEAVNVIDLETNPTLRAGYTDIRQSDPNFDPNQFLEGARAVYSLVLEAFWSGDRESLATYVSDDVAAQFNNAVDAREEAKQVVEGRVLAVEDARVTFARMHGAMAEVTVEYIADIVCVTRDEENRIVSGDPSDTVTSKDIWTFARDTRSNDPNWTLVATRSG